MTVRRKKDGSILDKIALAEYCELRRLELSRFEAFAERAAKHMSISLPDVPFETWDDKFESFCHTIPEGVRIRRAGDSE